jgi:hypothetical protein
MSLEPGGRVLDRPIVLLYEQNRGLLLGEAGGVNCPGADVLVKYVDIKEKEKTQSRWS